MSWFKRKPKPTFVIEVHLGEDNPSGEAAMLEPQKKYRVRVGSKENVREILAHEIGHCVESALGNPWNEEALLTLDTTGIATKAMIAGEAAAWRFAVKMFPDCRDKVVSIGFGSYLRLYRRGSAQTNFFNYILGGGQSASTRNQSG